MVNLVFSWDPTTRDWVKERGPSDAVSPFVPPVDDGAVQTYFLDPNNGRWTPTMLGSQARQIASELGRRYRAPLAPGLAFERFQPAQPSRGPRRALAVAVFALSFLIGGAAGQYVLGSTLDFFPLR